MSDRDSGAADDQLIGSDGSVIMDRIRRMGDHVRFLVSATADNEVADAGVHESLRHLHRDLRELQQQMGNKSSQGVADYHNP